MSYINCEILYQQLTKMIDDGNKLVEFNLLGEEFAGKAIIIPIEDEDND